MFQSDTFIYVDLSKTGTVTVNNWLRELGFPELDFRHHEKPSEKILASGLPVVATIRDPWSWYLSLWSFGARSGEMSGPYGALTTFAPLKRRGFSVNPTSAAVSTARYLIHALREDYRLNRKLYADRQDPTLFEKWLIKMLDRRTAWMLSGVYAESGMARVAGFYSYRYCNLLCRNARRLHSRSLSRYAELREWERSACYVDHFIQTHRLRDDFVATMTTLALCDDAARLRAVTGGSAKNISRAAGLSLRHFYDGRLVDMVAERERLLIDKFGYDFETLNAP